MAPVLQTHHGIDYHKNKFEERLRSGKITLENTKVGVLCLLFCFEICPNRHAIQAFIVTAIKDAITSGRTTLEALQAGVTTDHYNVLRLGFCAMILRAKNGDFSRIPETLVFNMRHFSYFNPEFDDLAYISLLLVSLTNFLKPMLRKYTTTSKDRDVHITNCNDLTTKIVNTVGEKIKDCKFQALSEVFLSIFNFFKSQVFFKLDF